MNDEIKALATRAVACKHWRLMDGMLLRAPHFFAPGCMASVSIRITRAGESDSEYPPTYVIDGDVLRDCDGREVWEAESEGYWPDLSDAATLGCLERLACDAWRADCIHIRTPVAPDMSGPRAWWAARDYRGYQHGCGEVRSSLVRPVCLVAALEAAP